MTKEQLERCRLLARSSVVGGDIKALVDAFDDLKAKNTEAARIFIAVRTVFGPVSHSDDAEGETWAKIDDWLTVKHSPDCDFVRFGHDTVCTCSAPQRDVK